MASSSQTNWVTGVVFSERLASHYNAWNKDFTERPQRLTQSIKRCSELGLLDRCKQIPLRDATEDEILSCHTKKHLELLKSTEEMNEGQLQEISQKYDYIYFHKKSYENAVLTVGGIVDLVDEIVSGKIRNGMAIIRPPGHHAMKEEFCGYCYFSNVAIAAQLALEKHQLKRILILDWDVHHGQGSQFKFYSDPRVLFASIHRYEDGEEWPYLRESDYDYIGEGPGRGYTINVPLNEVGLGNDEYLSIFFNLLLPVFYEFDPELVLVSAGYDCAVGCPEGEMAVTPACFAHFVNMLMPLASGKLALVLEGGYNLKSLSESVALSLRALLGDPTPRIAPLSGPKQSVVVSVLNCIKVLHPYWRSLRYQDLFESTDISTDCYPFSKVLDLPPVQDVKFYTPESRPDSFPLIQECADEIAFRRLESYNRFLDDLIQKTSLRCAENKISVASDRKEPVLYAYLKAKGLWSRCLSLEENLSQGATGQDCVKVCVDSVLTFKAQCSLCLVEGYSAQHNGTTDNESPISKSNIGLAVLHALQSDSIQRVLIVQLGLPQSHQLLGCTENSSILYISMNWPGITSTDSAQFTTDNHTSETAAHSVHVCIKENVMTCGDLLSAMFQIVLPVSYEFCPDLVIFTWRNPLGSAEAIRASFNPTCMGHVTQLLRGLAQGRLILLIESENSRSQKNTDSNIVDDLPSELVSECLSNILGGIPGRVGQILPSDGAVSTIKQVQDSLKGHWKIFQFRHSLPKVQI